MELVMPEGPEASLDLRRLATAQARRILARLVAGTRRAEVALRLVDLSKRHPALADAVLMDPTLSVSVLTDRFADAAATAAALLARLGELGGTPRSLPVRPTWNLAGDVLARPRTSLAVLDGALVVDGRHVSLTDDSVDLPAACERAFPRIDADIRLGLFDPNPYALDETHPEKEGNAVSLGGRTVEEWLASLRTALGLVDAHLPSIGAEMRELLRLVIPVGASDERHLSASYREYIGAVYVTLHRDPLTMAEALVHEFQHNKLNLLSWHYPILENGYDCLYRSPVRPDPRPLMGILLAAHAFVPVAELHRRVLEAEAPLLDPGFVRRRLADVVARNDEALAVLLRHATAAPAGRLLLDRLDELHQRHRGLALTLPADVSHVA